VQGVVAKQPAEGHEHDGKEHGADAPEAHGGELAAGGHTCPAPSYVVVTRGARLE
jgi:hypothetical protein